MELSFKKWLEDYGHVEPESYSNAEYGLPGVRSKYSTSTQKNYLVSKSKVNPDKLFGKKRNSINTYK